MTCAPAADHYGLEMSRQHINAYRAHLAKVHAVTGSLNEGVVSAAFGGLLEKWGRKTDLTLVNHVGERRVARHQYPG